MDAPRRERRITRCRDQLKFLTSILTAMAHWHSYLWFVRRRLMVGFTSQKEATMTKFKTLSAIVILFAAIGAPVLAQDAVGLQPVTDYRSNYRAPSQTFRGAYNQSDRTFYAQPLTNEERRNIEDFGFSGRDPSRGGGEDPDLHPAS